MSEDNNSEPIEIPPPEQEPQSDEPVVQIPLKPKPELIDIQTEDLELDISKKEE